MRVNPYRLVRCYPTNYIVTEVILMSRKNANNDGSLRKRANGTWEGRYTDGYNDAGKQIQRSVYGKTRKEVADKIRDILVKKQLGTYVVPSQYLLSDWMTQWLQTYAKNAIKPSTYISYEGYIYNHINPSLGSYPIQQITTPMVQEFYNQKFQSGSKRGGGLSPKTLRNMHNMFHQAMEQARIKRVKKNEMTIFPMGIAHILWRHL